MASTTTLPPEERPRRVLLIEDSELDRLILQRRLADETIRVLESSDGLEGLERCRRDPPDLILLDLGLPGCDGMEILRRLKDDCRTSAIPVIVISASSEPKDKVLSFELGAVDFVDKPYNIYELQARVRVALRTLRLQEMLERRAHVDVLTGLANRAAMEDRLITEWALYERHAVPLSVLIADLDRFKSINDTFGHAAGDAVLRKAADMLRASVRTSDLAARYGGEEFVVIAPHCEIPGGLKTAERFRQKLATAVVMVNGAAVSVTASVGVASVPGDRVTSPGDLLALADEALYQAKARGRDRVLCRADLARRPDEGSRVVHLPA